MPALPRITRHVTLTAHPEGTLTSSSFALTDVPLPSLAPHEVLVRNRWFRVSISTRLMASREATAIKGIPFPTLKPGDSLADGAIGEVIAATPESGLAPGMIVSHRLGWREHAVVDARHCKRLPSGPLDPAAYLGHGWTAYAALTRGITVKRGDTALVSSGAGAIGSMAGQIARRLGAARVIGSTGSADKAGWMTQALGYDAVIVRNGKPFATQLADAAPDGIDVFVDMVGGEQLTAAVAQAREGARFAILGALGAELHANHSTSVAPTEIDAFQLPIKGITLRGYSADDDEDVFDEWIKRQNAWRLDGSFHLPCTMFHGLENAPLALQEACAGKLKGVVLVEL
ncbi:NADP-dependent oxidoreductase [Pandoraea sp. PE-S2R-1]|uniref:MDR family NADP-dependent oxidoreductase n=1 Tax=Pandoraea sp. PE-S2R-1 TaxID=1986994 RepID=UPI000B3F943A|nr:NADP-dependent oxidoreductase [Pandoraea sp. PE-S2R-1]